jgi:hypothetical protein
VIRLGDPHLGLSIPRRDRHDQARQAAAGQGPRGTPRGRSAGPRDGSPIRKRPLHLLEHSVHGIGVHFSFHDLDHFEGLHFPEDRRVLRLGRRDLRFDDGPPHEGRIDASLCRDLFEVGCTEAIAAVCRHVGLVLELGRSAQYLA